MRLTRLALCLALAACGGSKKPATMPADTTAAPEPTGAGEPGGGATTTAEPIEATKAEPAMAPGAPAGASAPADATKPVTRGAKPRPKTGDPDAGGE